MDIKRIASVILSAAMMLCAAVAIDTAEDSNAAGRLSDPDLEALMERYPEYFGLSTFKGLEVYVWQVNSASYSFGLMPGTNINKTEQQLLALKGASAEEMRAILSTYDIPEENIAVIPWQNPVSSYLPEYCIVFSGEGPEAARQRRREYAENVRGMLFEGEKPVGAPRK
ncbi:MAG: hypothetical protein II173_00065 [Firmicutes bacterium]|nr:hypothetical protein [Bacillota bacterium]